MDEMTPREIAQKIVDDATTRLVCMKPMYDSVDLGERLIELAIAQALAALSDQPPSALDSKLEAEGLGVVPGSYGITETEL